MNNIRDFLKDIQKCNNNCNNCKGCKFKYTNVNGEEIFSISEIEKMIQDDISDMVDCLKNLSNIQERAVKATFNVWKNFLQAI